MQINEKARVRCASGHEHDFKDWRWDCGNHKGEYLAGEARLVAATMQRALGAMKGFTDENADAMWLMALCANLGRQYGL